MEPFSVSAIWSSDNTGVATIESSGLATAQNVGSARLRAQLRTFVYVDTGSFGCESGLRHPIVNAVCNVLAREVTFDYAKLYNLQKDFLFNQVTLSAGASGRGEQICDKSQDFEVTAHFRVPNDARALSETRSFVKVFGEPPNTNNFVVRGWRFANVRLSSPPKSGDVIITLARRDFRPPSPDVPHETIIVHIAGDYEFGGFDDPGYIKITCH